MSSTKPPFDCSESSEILARSRSEGQSAMIGKSDIPFAELRQFLLDLGFTVCRRGKFWLFEHIPSETTFLFRPYQPREKVTLVDIQSTRRHLDLRGVLDQQAFDSQFKKATA